MDSKLLVGIKDLYFSVPNPLNFNTGESLAKLRGGLIFLEWNIASVDYGILRLVLHPFKINTSTNVVLLHPSIVLTNLNRKSDEVRLCLFLSNYYQ